MKPTIYLALTDDWELRGDGSGDIEKIQFHPMRELVRLYNKSGVRGTFNVEIMQQLAFRKNETKHPELKALADRWDVHVTGAYSQGHDIQLHLHTQWSDARYIDGAWRLSGDWSILNYEPHVAREMLVAGKMYIENLLRSVDSNYRCVAFRAGALSIAPSKHILQTLVEIGIVLDTSLVGGLRVNTRNLQFDYTDCDEDFLPFYPLMTDARQVSDKPEKIVCLPIHHFQGSRRGVIKQVVTLGSRKVLNRLKPNTTRNKTENSYGYAQKEWSNVKQSSRLAWVNEKAIKPCLKGKHLTSDFSRLNDSFMREMLRDIRRRAAGTGLSDIPVVLTNHSKYVDDFAPIERFLSEASRASDIKFITLSELAKRLQAGEFHIRSAQ